MAAAFVYVNHSTLIRGIGKSALVGNAAPSSTRAGVSSRRPLLLPEKPYGRQRGPHAPSSAPSVSHAENTSSREEHSKP
jgi:hypothetical protein